MHTLPGRISEIRLNENLEQIAWIDCPPEATPAAGRYTMTWSEEEDDAPLATVVFASEISSKGFLTATPVPGCWQPGLHLTLNGPCGHGFEIPSNVRRLAVTAFGKSVARLLPVIKGEYQSSRSVALFADCLLPRLPSDVEVNPLSLFTDAFEWADFLVCDLPTEFIPEFRSELIKNSIDGKPALPGQVLVITSMPCGGISECGACAIQVSHSVKYVCKDGPVFDLQTLLK